MTHRFTPVCHMLYSVTGEMKQRSDNKLKRKEKFMQMTQERSEDNALTMDKCAATLGLAEFSVFSRVQTGDIKAMRARSGEMLIPGSEMERLVNGFANKPSVSDGTILPDSTLGIKTTWGGWSEFLSCVIGFRALMVFCGKTTCPVIAPPPARLRHR